MEQLGIFAGNLATYVLPVMVIMAILLVVGRSVFGFAAQHVHGYSFTEQAITKDNPAVLIRLGGILFASVVAFTGTVKPTGLGVLYDIAMIAQTAVFVLGALWVSLWINDKFILSKFPNTFEVVEKRNVAAAVVEASTLIATALIFSGAFGGSDDKLVVELVWFAIGQVVLIALAGLYSTVMIRNVGDHIGDQNVAVALSMGGLLIAAGMTLGKAVSGSFTDWPTEIGNVAAMLFAWLIFMGGLRLLMNYVLIPGSRLKKELVEDRNWGIGLMDGALSIALTAVFTTLVV